MEHQQLYATEHEYYIISSKESISYLELHLNEAIMTKYL
jgi:hypothetical protein